MRKTALGVVGALIVTMTLCQCGGENLKTDVSEESFMHFLVDVEQKIAPLNRDIAIANFEASVSGRAEDYERAAKLQLKLKTFLSDAEVFSMLEAWRDGEQVANPILSRQLDVLHSLFLENQLPETTLAELVSRQSAIEKRFNTHRAKIDGKELSDNEVSAILRESTDSVELEKAWLASKQIGKQVADDIVELVKLRNQAAQSLGFDNFQVMELALSEQDPEQIEALFDALDVMTRDAFVEAKSEIDAHLARRLGITIDELRPWHYQNPFFQEAPTIYPVNLDGYYAKTDLVKITKKFYSSIGLEVGDIVERSDLFEKPGKYQHAFCEDVDRRGDVRVLCSVKPNTYWMNTLLHEFGHGVYAKYNDVEVPYLLRDAAHSFTTEAIANLFGRFASHPDWLHDMMGISVEEREKIRAAAASSLRLEQLVFSRWSQVMFRFEKSLYENPDQDLNTLWWNLVENYQLLSPPDGRNEPDWAAKIHVALYPAYYHNYLMGELLASQLYSFIGRAVLKTENIYRQSFVGQEEVGNYLWQKVFMPGKTKTWNEMIEAATGEPLTPLYYADQFVSGS
jgi:peptidyl-dipeptidase A